MPKFGRFEKISFATCFGLVLLFIASQNPVKTKISVDQGEIAYITDNPATLYRDTGTPKTSGRVRWGP